MLSLKAITALTLGAVTVVALLILSPLLWLQDLIIVAAGLAIVALYAHAVGRTRAKRHTNSAQLAIRPERQWVSDATFDRLRFTLTTDDPPGSGQDSDVLLVTRLHWVYLVVSAGLPALLGVGLIIYLLFGADGSMWWLPLTFLAVLVAIWISAMDWLYRFIMITNTSLIIMRVPPLWLPLMQAPINRLALSSVRLVRNDDSFIGNLLGFGTVEADTPLQKDESFNRMQWLPKHEQIVHILQSASHRS